MTTWERFLAASVGGYHSDFSAIGEPQPHSPQQSGFQLPCSCEFSECLISALGVMVDLNICDFYSF